ncbi:MAG: LysO family transporter, partial [Deferrisomatales bacterium]
MIWAVAAAVALGVGAAQVGALPAWLVERSGEATGWMLGLLLLLIGYDLTRDREALKRLLRADRHAFLAPLGTVAGTLAGGAAVAALAGLPLRDALAVAAGFGWYSLSAVLIAEVRGADLGSIAFLANVFRELLAIAAIPLVARTLGPYASVSLGGATTMDTTLPILERYAGPGAAA